MSQSSSSYTLKSDDDSGEMIKIVTGGQEVEYDSKFVIQNINSVKDLVRSFYEGKNLLENFSWYQEY